MNNQPESGFVFGFYSTQKMTLNDVLNTEICSEIAAEFNFDLASFKNMFVEIHHIIRSEEWTDFSSFTLPPAVTQALELLNTLSPLSGQDDDDEWGDYAPQSQEKGAPDPDLDPANIQQLLSLIAYNNDVCSEIVSDQRLFHQASSFLLEACGSESLVDLSMLAFQRLLRYSDLVGNYDQLIDLFKLIPPLLSRSASYEISESAHLLLVILSRRIVLVQSREAVSCCVKLSHEIKNNSRAVDSIRQADPNLSCFERWEACDLMREYEH